MCIKLLSKTLNPKAKEWRPTPKQPHPPPSHLLLPQPLQPAVHAAVFNPTPPYYYPNPQPTYQGFIHYSVHTQCRPFYNVSFPAHEINSCKAEMAAQSSFENETTLKNFTEKKKMEGQRVKSPKCPPVDHVFKQVYKRAYPPRVKKLIGRFIADSNNPPPPSKQEWRPKKSSKADYSFSGNGAVAHSPPPPPPSGDCRTLRSQNTTVMIKNIPNQLRRDFMLKFLDDYCKTYSLEYDFFYLPIDFRKKGNLGYAFVNFTTSVAALKFKKILQNFKWGMVCAEGRGAFNSNKICEITWARIQGQKALIERFQKSSFACDRFDFLPVILDPPRNGSDPNPSPPVILGSLDRTTLRKTVICR